MTEVQNAETPVHDATDLGSRKLDYSLETPEERNELVKKIIDETPPEQLTNKYLCQTYKKRTHFLKR